MYKLTLTAGERQAIDLVGDRYAHGDELYSLLCDADWGSCRDWAENVDITFNIPEGIAWGIVDVAEAGDYQWALFSNDLARKMTDFCDKII